MCQMRVRERKSQGECVYLGFLMSCLKTLGQPRCTCTSKLKEDSWLSAGWKTKTNPQGWYTNPNLVTRILQWLEYTWMHFNSCCTTHKISCWWLKILQPIFGKGPSERVLLESTVLLANLSRPISFHGWRSSPMNLNWICWTKTIGSHWCSHILPTQQVRKTQQVGGGSLDLRPCHGSNCQNIG